MPSNLLGVPSVVQILTALPLAWCLECLIRRTRLRAADALRQIDALPLQFKEGVCAVCAESAAVVALASIQ
jgi:hypothetical protein